MDPGYHDYDENLPGRLKTHGGTQSIIAKTVKDEVSTVFLFVGGKEYQEKI